MAKVAELTHAQLDDMINPPALVQGDDSLANITETVCKIAENKPPKVWYLAFMIALGVLGMLGISLVYIIRTGVGVWGNNQPVAWGWPIVNFVFWVGIGHAGTLISAVLYLFRQGWRTGINRFAEAMTIFAVCCAGMFPAIHVGRV